MNILLLTKNTGKIKAAESVFNKYGIRVHSIVKEYQEIQADCSLDIARYSAIQASNDYNNIVIREDHSLYINALGIPGPYTNFIEKKILPENIIKLTEFFGDNSGYFEVATVCAWPDGKTIENVFQVPITIGSKIIMEGKGWNSIIRLQDEERTLTEYPEEERLHIWNQGYEMIAKKLTQK